MPYETDVDEKETYWCPKWYWPFAVCTRTVKVHKWCYQFAWVEETSYVGFSYLEGCENGKLYSWYAPSLKLPGGETYAAGERCFNSPRTSEGKCDPSRTGLLASGLSGRKPGFSDFDVSIRDISSKVADSGIFEFTPENGGLCRLGSWPWQRVLHEQEISLSVNLNGVSAQWYVGGVQATGQSGTLSIGASCKWPFPLPKGRRENRVVQIAYNVTTSASKSTLRLMNRSSDGSYGISVGMQAMLNGKEFNSLYTSTHFTGETCDFDPVKYKEMGDCIRRFRDATREKVKFKKPKPGEPVVAVFEDIWPLIREDRKEIVASLVDIMNNTVSDDPQTYTQAMDQLEQETGWTDMSRVFRIGPAPAEHAMRNRMPNAALATGLALGLAVLAAKLFTSRGRRK